MASVLHEQILIALARVRSAGTWTVRERREAPHSRCCLVQCAEAPSESVFVKEFVRSDASAAARREFAALEHLWMYREQNPFRTPRPIAHVEDPPSILMGLLAGEKLDEGLPAKLRRPWPLGNGRALTRRFRALGAALEEFGRIPPPGPTSISLDPLSDRCGECLASPALGTLLGPRIAAELSARLKHLSKLLSGRRSTAHSVHGDFGPWNVLRTGRELSLIDFDRYGPGHRLADLAMLFATLDRLVVMSSAPQRRSDALKEAALGGFGGVGPEETPEWELSRLCSSLTLVSWIQGYDRSMGDKRRIAAHLAAAALAGGSR